MIARMALLLVKINLVPVAVATIVRLAMIRTALLLQLSRTRRLTYLSGSTNAVGLYLSLTMIRWLILRKCLAAGGPLVGCYRISDYVADMMMETGTGTGGSGDDDFL